MARSTTKRRKGPPITGKAARELAVTDPAQIASLGLGGKIDYLGFLRERIAHLKDAEGRFARAVRKAIAGRKGPTKGTAFEAALDDVETIQLAYKPVERLASRRGVAMEVLVRPDLAACRKVLGDKTVEAIGTPHHSRRLRVERIKAARPAKRAKK